MRARSSSAAKFTKWRWLRCALCESYIFVWCVLVISTTDSSSGRQSTGRHQQVTSPISTTTARPAAAAVERLSDAAAAVKRDVVSSEEDHLALSDLREPLNSMSSSTRQNNKACHTLNSHSTSPNNMANISSDKSNPFKSPVTDIASLNINSWARLMLWPVNAVPRSCSPLQFTPIRLSFPAVGRDISLLSWVWDQKYVCSRPLRFVIVPRDFCTYRLYLRDACTPLLTASSKEDVRRWSTCSSNSLSK